MAVRTGLQPRRSRIVKDLGGGASISNLLKAERLKKEMALQEVERARSRIKKLVNDPEIAKGLNLSPERLEREVKQGISQSISGRSVKIKFKKREKRKELMLKELR